MANHVSVGKPANDAEKWAFNFLKENLPDHYILITNVDVYSDTNQPFEVDAIVIADWGIYLVDVKGYRGNLIASKDIWKHESRIVENPLPKLNQNSRILASRCKSRLKQGQHAPWCQAFIFVTGGLGEDIKISTGEYDLPVFAPENIIPALTLPEYVTARHKHKLEEYQRNLAVEAICDFKLLKEKEQKVSNYIKIERLSVKNEIEIWVVKPEGHTFDYRYWMKYVDLTSKPADFSLKLRSQFKKEYYLLSELSDLPLVPAILFYHDDGESLALVHQEISGTQLSKSQDIDLFSILESVLNALVIMKNKGILHRALSPDSIYIKDNKVQLLNVGYAISRDINTIASSSQLAIPYWPIEYIEKGIYTGKSLSYQFALIFLPYIVDNPSKKRFTLDFHSVDYHPIFKKEIKSVDGISDWFQNALDENPENRPELEDLLSCFQGKEETTTDSIELQCGNTIANKYRLEECIGRGGTASIWRATHLLGEYDCCLKILDSFDGAEDLAKKEFEMLRTLYHPNIVRIFDLDIIPGNDNYFLTCEYLDGTTLDQLEDEPVDIIISYFEHILSALQYLHRMGRMHKDVKPENIMIVSGKAYLIDFNISLVDSKLVGTTRYKDPMVKTEGWNPISDIYSLIISFVEITTGIHPFCENEEIPSSDVRPVISEDIALYFPALKPKFEQILRREINWNSINDYLSWFKLSTSVNLELPRDLLERWKIKNGYMNKVLVTMLGDMQARSRTVVIKNTLKSFGIIGNKSSRGSVNAAISQLKNVNVIEEYGKKIRFTQGFLTEWERSKTN
ncbi:MAG: protein kinase [Proteobacteria bacterium]|nr:protein kinase [Pseudomonadota bacterium]